MVEGSRYSEIDESGLLPEQEQHPLGDSLARVGET